MSRIKQEQLSDILISTCFSSVKNALLLSITHRLLVTERAQNLAVRNL